MRHSTTLRRPIRQGDSRLLSLPLTNHVGALITPSTVTLTLYDVESEDVINGRDHVSVLDENGGTVRDGGILDLVLEPADTVIVGTRDSFEREPHRALIEWTWEEGGSPGEVRRRSHEFLFDVEAHPHAS